MTEVKAKAEAADAIETTRLWMQRATQKPKVLLRFIQRHHPEASLPLSLRALLQVTRLVHRRVLVKQARQAQQGKQAKLDQTMAIRHRSSIRQPQLRPHRHQQLHPHLHPPSLDHSPPDIAFSTGWSPPLQPPPSTAHLAAGGPGDRDQLDEVQSSSSTTAATTTASVEQQTDDAARSVCKVLREGMFAALAEGRGARTVHDALCAVELADPKRALLCSFAWYAMHIRQAVELGHPDADALFHADMADWPVSLANDRAVTELPHPLHEPRPDKRRLCEWAATLWSRWGTGEDGGEEEEKQQQEGKTAGKTGTQDATEQQLVIHFDRQTTPCASDCDVCIGLVWLWWRIVLCAMGHKDMADVIVRNDRRTVDQQAEWIIAQMAR